jgi:two-component system response regulator WspF
MDLAVPGLDGVEATRQIMIKSPCAILVLSTNINKDTAAIFNAMGAGALDAVAMPVLDKGTTLEEIRPLIKKLDQIARLITPVTPRGALPPRKKDERLVVIGASAGGPPALATVLQALPSNYGASVVIVQHVDPHFAPSLASWLHQHSPLPVRLAEEGDRLHAGQVYVAAREEHLILTSPNRLGYTRAPAETSYRPSVDIFFKSVDHYWQGELVAVLLTGMGRDGAEGLRLLRGSGHHTIAQDRISSAVYGMPKAAADLGAASEILALDKIGPRLASLFLNH